MLARASVDFDLLAEWFGFNFGIQLAIFCQLSFKDVLALMTLNHRFYEALKNNDYWKEQLYRHFLAPVEFGGSKQGMPPASIATFRKEHHLTPNSSSLDYFKVFAKAKTPHGQWRVSYYDAANLSFDKIRLLPEASKEAFFAQVCRYFHQNNGFDYTKVCEYQGRTFLQYAIRFDRLEFIKRIPSKIFEELAPQYPLFVDTLELLGSEAMLRLFKEKGLSLETPDSSGKTMLHQSIQQRDMMGVKTLCDLGVNVNARNPFGETPLQVAAKIGHYKIFSLLMEYGADPLLKSTKSTRENKNYLALPEESTLLHFASYGRNVALIQAVIDHIRKTANVDVALALNARNTDGYSPLEVAASIGSESVFDVLLKEESVAITDAVLNVDGNSMLHLVIRGQNINLFNRLMSLGIFKLTDQNAKGETPLHFIARYFRGPQTGFMINLCFRADVNLIEAKTNDHADIPGATPLHYAVAYNNQKAVEQLLHEFVDVNALTADGRTAIYLLVQFSRNIAPRESFHKMANMLMERGVDLRLAKYRYTGEDETLKEQNGDTLMHAAVRFGRDVFDVVLRWPGVDLNAKNANGDTPLHVAAKLSDDYHVNALLEAFATLNVVNNQNETPLISLIKNNKFKFIDFFFDNSAVPEKNALRGMTEINLSDQSIGYANLLRLLEVMPEVTTVKLVGRVNIIADPRFPLLLENKFYSVRTIDISEIDCWSKKDESYHSFKLLLKSSPNVTRVICEDFTPEQVERLFDVYRELQAECGHRYASLMMESRYEDAGDLTKMPFAFFQPAALEAPEKDEEKRPSAGPDSSSKRTRLG